MAMTLNFFIVLYLFMISCHQSVTLFISKNGKDQQSCGNSTNNPCASELTDNTDHIEIHIIDGQNQDDILGYNISENTHGFDPCLPKRFNADVDVTIIFNEILINNMIMNDWYPKNICYGKNISYQNEYMFDGGNSLKIHNLMVTDYPHNNTETFYYFIRNNNRRGGSPFD
eukprot:17474_1